jgi:hypothetical protein
LELGDRVYARSVERYGQITARAYLGLYLLPYLPKRNA